MKHVFISYVREDSEIVVLLKTMLQIAGEINVWLDRDSIDPGERWKDAIRKAIAEGAYFIACFSDNYLKKDVSYMNEEVAIAIEQIKKRPSDKTWFIPIRLSDCQVPNRSIGDNETLNDLQVVDFFDNFEDGINSLLSHLIPAMSPRLFSKNILKANLESHITSKIEHYKRTGVQRFKEIEDKWFGLLEEHLLDNLSRSFVELRERSKFTGKPELDRVIEAGDQGRYILLSVVPFIDTQRFVNSVNTSFDYDTHPYIEFILAERKTFYRQSKMWPKKDFVHMIYMEEGNDTIFDILYNIDLDLEIKIINHFVNTQKNKDDTAIMYEIMYPTSIINSIDMGELHMAIRKENLSLLDKMIDNVCRRKIGSEEGSG